MDTTPPPDAQALPSAPPWGLFRARLLGWLRPRLDDPADAEDLVQEVLGRAAIRLSELQSGERLLPWLFRIARNALVDHYRARGRRGRAVAFEDLPASQEPGAPVASAVGEARAELASCLEPMVAALPDPYREAVRRVDLRGERQVDVAGDLGLGISTLKSRVQRGRRLLHRAFTDCCELERDRMGSVVGYERRGGTACVPQVPAGVPSHNCGPVGGLDSAGCPSSS
jgi:RNA polymerase sigma-70 factor (ECF subfamily)